MKTRIISIPAIFTGVKASNRQHRIRAKAEREHAKALAEALAARAAGKI